MRKKNKKPINWRELLASALIDLIVGFLLLIIDKVIS